MAVRDAVGTPGRHSLKWRVPATFALLIGGVLITFVWVAHRTLERTLVEAGGARLASAVEVLAQLLDRRPLLEQLTTAAGNEALVGHLRSPTSATAAAARAHLRGLTSTTARRVELWDAAGARVLDVSASAVAPLPPLDAAPSRGVSPLRAAADVVFYDLAVPVGDGLGHLAVRTAFTPANSRAVSRLVGEEAVVLVGNRDGSFWFDLSGEVRGPAVLPSREGLTEYRDEAGQRRIGGGESVSGAPWIAWVEFPRAILVRDADAFLMRMVPVALGFLVIGAAVAWMASARVTGPIAQLSDAAEAVAAGNYSRRIDVDGRDEVGRLAQAFNVMTAEIEESRQRLEARVDERTTELAAARAEADAANRAKNEFLSLMSHDLRTPLNAVLGFAQLLESDQLTPEQAEHVSHILNGGRHLLALISDVLDITRIESGQLGLSLEPVAVRDLVLGAVDLVRPLALKRGICIKVDDVFGDAAVSADAQRLQQILLNLLSNAVKYNRENGAVTVSGTRLDAKRFRITVADTGIGLSEAQMERLFHPFERLGAEQTAVEGTGLGLALSRALAEAMGGSLGVASTAGTGSTFWVELAETEQAAPAERDVSEEPLLAPTSGGLVLYIEDNLSNVRLLQRILERRPGVELLHAPTGAKGVSVTRERQPDLVLIDLHLPDTTGEQVLRRLASDPRTHGIPRIVVTADATPGLARRLEAEGAVACLTKPLNVGDVLRLMDRLLSQWNGEGIDV